MKNWPKIDESMHYLADFDEFGQHRFRRFSKTLQKYLAEIDEFATLNFYQKYRKKNSKIPISTSPSFNDKHTRARSEREREKENTKTKNTKHGERQQEESEKESAKSSIGGVRICDDDDDNSNNKAASERFLQRENGSFPFETDSFTVSGTSGVAGKTPIIPHADEE